MWIFWLLIVIVLCFVGSKFYIRPDLREGIYIWFGIPRSGKTTFAAWLARHAQRKGIPVWSNVPIKGCMKMNLREDFGTHLMEDGVLIGDEIGVDANGRAWKSFSDAMNYGVRYVGHYKLCANFFGQRWSDADATIRGCAVCYYIVNRSAIPFCIKRRTIRCKIDIDPMTHQPCDYFYFEPFGTKYIFAPPVWKMFDTHERKELTPKQWEVYE